MNKIIDQIKNTISGLRKGNVKETPSQSSVNWFSKKLQNIKNTTKGKVNPQNDSARKNIINEKFATKAFKYKKSGYIYFFNYQPPNSRNLPFYDRFPLVLSMGFNGSNVVGINLHYLPIRIRLYVMYKVVKSISSNPKENSRIRVNSLLSSRVIRKYIMALGEEYTATGIRSKIKLVTPDEFMIMAFLPLQKFAKKQAPQVNQHIRSIIKGIK
jgi:hypothetical protein